MDARVLIFKEEDFPFVDTTAVQTQEIIEALPPMQEVRSVEVSELKKRLRADSIDLLINPYGSAFPMDAWPEIHDYLASGGNLLNLGGAPFSVPMRHDGEGWRQEISQTQYHRELGINQAYPVDMTDVKRYHTTSTEPLLSGLIEEFACDRVFELQVKLTSRSDDSAEFGTSGAREAVLRPLLYAYDSEGRRIAAPIIAIDRILGESAGGRWVLANFDSKALLRKEAIGRLAAYAALGATDMQIRPSFACYTTDERPGLILHVNRFEKPGTKWNPLNLFITIRKDKTTVKTESIDISDFASPYYLSIPIIQPLTTGLYNIEARLSWGEVELTDKFADYSSTGFWCYDNALVGMTQPLSAGKDFFTREDKPIPLIGTTYMASDVHRKFLFEPNPAAWDRDFAEMKECGINVVRTGLWTGFRRIMLDPGAPSEEVMRAFEAFMMTAAEHEMPVIFSFFGSAPETWGGEDPYLDPRCIQAQKEFVAAFTRRFAKFNNLMWKLIDEPRVECERDALASSSPPSSWVREMSAVIRQNGNPRQLITVGGGGDREEVDFTCATTGLMQDDLLWDSLITKTPKKPNLIGKAFSTLTEIPDRWPEEDGRNLIERGFVTAFATGGAGFVQRNWSSDVYTTSDSEAAVGFHRGDLTRKRELDVVRPMVAFLKEARPHFIDRKPESACVVIPDSAVSSAHDPTTLAARTCVRLMSYHLGIPTRTVGEHSTENLGKPKLIVLPSPGRLSQGAWETLMGAVEAGSTMLVTGPIDQDEQQQPVGRLSKLGIEAVTQPVACEEEAIIFGSEYRVSFGGDKIPHIDKSVLGGLGGTVRTVQAGAGKLVYCALPVELADNIEPTIAIYQFALKQAVLQPPFSIDEIDPGVLIRPMLFKDAALYSLVSETDADRELSFTDLATQRTLKVNVPARRAVMFVLGRDGRVLAQYGGCVEG